MNNRPDKELVLQLQKNNIKAFDAIYFKYHATLYINIQKLTKKAEITQDLVQEVFISLWEKRATMDPDKPVLNWLITVSYHKTINHLKNSLREAVRKEALIKMNELDENETSLLDIQLQLVEKAVKLLSPQKSRVFQLCKLEGKTYDETAKEMNISKYTVKEYLVDAVVQIKEYIKRHPAPSSISLYAVLLTLLK